MPTPSYPQILSLLTFWWQWHHMPLHHVLPVYKHAYIHIWGLQTTHFWWVQWHLEDAIGPKTHFLPIGQYPCQICTLNSRLHGCVLPVCLLCMGHCWCLNVSLVCLYLLTCLQTKFPFGIIINLLLLLLLLKTFCSGIRPALTRIVISRLSRIVSLEQWSEPILGYGPPWSQPGFWITPTSNCMAWLLKMSHMSLPLY